MSAPPGRRVITPQSHRGPLGHEVPTGRQLCNRPPHTQWAALPEHNGCRWRPGINRRRNGPPRRGCVRRHACPGPVPADRPAPIGRHGRAGARAAAQQRRRCPWGGLRLAWHSEVMRIEEQRLRRLRGPESPPDQPVPPTCGEGGDIGVDAFGVDAVRGMEGRHLPDGSVNLVGQGAVRVVEKGQSPTGGELTRPSPATVGTPEDFGCRFSGGGEMSTQSLRLRVLRSAF